MMKYLSRLAVIPLAGAALAGCAGSPTFLAPNSSIAAQQASLYWTILWMAVGVFVVVEGLLLYNIIRFRARKSDDSIPPQIHGHNTLEAIWTGIPIIIVAVIFIGAVGTANAISAPPKASSDINVTVRGHQWWWEYDYPDLQIVTANDLHVPVGATVQITMESADVIHSFWIPQLSGKIDVVPGQVNHLWFRADRAGAFKGQCAEFCGLNHANMRINVIVEPQADFEKWVANQQSPLVQPQTDQQKKGYQIITSGLCSNCHTLGTNQAAQPIGPNLTHLMSRSTFAGAIYDLNEGSLRKWLQDTQAMKPGNDMKVKLKSDDIDALMAYLTTLK